VEWRGRRQMEYTRAALEAEVSGAREVELLR